MTSNLPQPLTSGQDVDVLDPWLYVPDHHVGKIEPNWYCRGWNSKREKYCRWRAGSGTDHLGQGRCKMHGGSTPIKTGRYSDVARGTVREHFEALEMETDEQKMDTLPEVTMIRALARDYVERYEAIRDALLAWNEEEVIDAGASRRPAKLQPIPDITDVAKLLGMATDVIAKIHKATAANAVPMKDLYRLMGLMAEVVNQEIDEQVGPAVGQDIADKIKASIRKRWLEIRLKA